MHRLVGSLLAMSMIVVLASCLGSGGGSDSATVTVTTPGAPPPTPGPVLVGATITSITNPGGVSNVTVNVSGVNPFVAGDVVTIGGTAAYNGTYTIVSVTPASFVIAPMAGGNETPASATAQSGGGLIPGCVTTVTAGVAGQITLSHTPNRFSGVAPLAVFFDASATTALATSKPFHELDYTWGFGDGASGTWSQGARPGNSRNAAKGPVSAHIFETPGTYTVSLIVTDGTNTVRNQCIQIAVQSPDQVFANANTVCVAAGAAPVAGVGGCPAGATTVSNADFPNIVSTHLLTNKRVLLKTGDTFGGIAPTGIAVLISQNGPWILGSFGGGAKPKIQISGSAATTTDVIAIGSGVGVFAADGRIMDLEINGLSWTGTGNLRAVDGRGNFDQLTLLRLNINNMGDGINFYPSSGYLNLAGNTHVWRDMFIVDNTIDTITGGGATHGIFVYADRFALLGTLIDDTSASEHLLRMDHIGKGVISNNTLRNGPTDAGPAGNKESIALRGVGSSSPSGNTDETVAYFKEIMPNNPTEHVVISDNDITVDGFAGIKLGPINNNVTSTIRDIITERNVYRAPAVFGCSGGTNRCAQFAIQTQANRHTMRNELVYFDNFRFYTAFNLLAASTGMPAANSMDIFNNSAYTGDSSGGAISFALLDAAGPANVRVKNNLVYAPNLTGSSSIHICAGGCGAVVGLNVSNNSTDGSGSNQIRLTSPLFAVTPPVTPANWTPGPGSYAIGAGTSVPVWSDLLGVARPPHDLGAVVP